MDIMNLVDDLTFVEVPPSPYYALGPMADYRAELFHALQRYFVQLEHFKAGRDMILVHSLIDSFAWAVYNAERRIANAVIDDGQDAVMAVFVGQILLDSLKADHVFLIETVGEDDLTIFAHLAGVANNIKVPVTVLYEEDKEQWPEICAKIVREERG